MTNAGSSSSPCTNCGAALPQGARFCNACGTPVVAVGTQTIRPRTAPNPHGNAIYLPWGLAAVLLVASSAYFSGETGAESGPRGAPMAPPPFSSGAAGAEAAPPSAGGAPPDIANMSPRERAGRLHDRIMRYAEQGKRDSVGFFAPMALASFEMLGADLDLDGRYDYGRVATETGNLEIAAAQADTILRAAPTHLLGLSLKARTATARGDAALAAATWKQFLAAREAELGKKLPEYGVHAADIELSVKLAAGGQ